jgi:predicted transcriptional regulator
VVKVKDIMKKHVVTIDPDVTMSIVAKILTNNRIGSAVIVKNDKPVGMVTTNDIVTLIARGKDPKRIKAGKFWKERNRPFITVSPDDSVLNVAKKMIKSGLKRFPIVKDGKLKGIISTKEILLVSPELIEVLSEKLKAKVDAVARPDQTISGLCESCDSYSDDLRNIDGRWICSECSEETEE